MRCVSYTRTTSCCKTEDVPVYTIAEQNEHIKAYVNTHGFRLEKKYSDRKDDSEEISDFEKMRMDGQNRSFDILIFDSFWQCGKDIFTIVRVLRDALYPAGIHFAVVQEEFCSAGRDHDEVIAYLDDAWKRYNSHLLECKCARNPLIHYIETYGYRYDRENDVLTIDEESATVVREIFEKLLQGITPGKIGKELTLRGIEKPGDYYCRMKGWALRGNNRGWDAGTVMHVAKNPKFAGRWERIANGKNYADDCKPIIAPEVFDEVQKIMNRRRHHDKECQNNANPFRKMITDEETGAAVKMKQDPARDRLVLHFRPPKPEGVRYEKTYLDLEDAIEQMRDILQAEHDKAVVAADYLKSFDAQSYRDLLIEQKRGLVPELLRELFQANTKSLSLYKLYESGRIEEAKYAEDTAALNVKRKAAATALSKIYDEIIDIKKCFSADNPWVALFSNYDENHELTREYLRDFCEHVMIWRFEKIKPILKEVKWRKGLTASWEEVCDGSYKQTAQ